MILLGNNLIDKNDSLRRVSLDYLYQNLIDPIPEVRALISQLRIIKNINADQYNALKKRLPYFIGATFNPPIRLISNFAYTQYFVIEIDHIYDKDLDMDAVRTKIQSDPRVIMSFLSPGENGLKILFRLKERCYDSGLYALFYKKFLKEFSRRYGLEQIIDDETSDVCRACYLSIDSDTYFNQDAEPVDLDAYLPQGDIAALYTIKSQQEKEIKQNKNNMKNNKSEPEDEIMQRVKALLNNDNQSQKEKNAPFVPQQLNEIIGELKNYIESTGIMLYDIVDIQYGKKLKFKLGVKIAEINLFFGKNGFTVVKSPRRGTSPELNETMARLVNSFVVNII